MAAVDPDLAAEILMAREIDALGYRSGTALYDNEREALRRLVGKGHVLDDLTSARRYTLTEAGLKWLAEQED